MEMIIMLLNFLEKNIQNKVKILSILQMQQKITFQDLKQHIHISSSNIHTIIQDMNIELKNSIHIKKESNSYSLSMENNFVQCCHRIFQHSQVLQCLRFLIMNEKKESFQKYIDQAFLTKSSAYRIRQVAENYLHCIGLNIQNNYVIGPEYRIRFLIALLYYKYGIECYEIQKKDVQIARQFILSTNDVIDASFLTNTEIEYGYFEYLLILSWKRKNFSLETIDTEIFSKLKTLFVYEKLIEHLHKTIEPALSLSYNREDYDYLYLVYLSTNSCIFADKWTQDDIQYLHTITFENAMYQDLLQRFTKLFGKTICLSHVFRSTLIYFYRHCLLDLQCIIPDKNLFIVSKQDKYTQIVYKKIQTIVEDWRVANHLQYPFDEDHIFYLSLQIKFIIRQFIPSIPVYICSDHNAELEVMLLHLYRLFSQRRITIHPLLLNAQNTNFIQEQTNSIFLVRKKFVQLLDSLKISEHNTIVVISAEMNDDQIQTFHRSIEKYEKQQFLDFLQKDIQSD